MIFSKIAGDISEIAGDLAISEQSVKKIIIPALNLDPKTYLFTILVRKSRGGTLFVTVYPSRRKTQ